jgi:hypothetical protein
MKNTLRLLAAVFLVSGCAMQRAGIANDAQSKMIGLSKEQVLACMGPAASKSAEGATEVWLYATGNGQTDTSSFASAMAWRPRLSSGI